jgi:hypothetical protein
MPGSIEEQYAEPESFVRLLGSIDADWVEEALEATGTATIRRRRLPAEQVVWLVLGMALLRRMSIEQVLRYLQLALPGGRGVTVAPSAIVQARARLGSEPMRWLFERCAQTWARDSAERHRWRGLAVYGVDGTTLRVPDSEENRAHFGGQRGRDGEQGGYPQARLVTLMVLRSHLLAAARCGPYSSGETTLASELWPLLPDNSLCIVDRAFLAAPCLTAIAGVGSNRHWMTRAKTKTRWTVLKRFSKRDALVELEVSRQTRRDNPQIPERWLMRAIDYQRPGYKPQVLLTSLLDPHAAPAGELIALYHERWELELGYDEVKTQILDRQEALRSRSVEGLTQEIWGVGLLYNLVRLEMEQIAAQAGVPPTRISFGHSLLYIQTCWVTCGADPNPGYIPKLLRYLRSDLTQFVLPERRTRRLYPRAVKIKMSNYPRKRGKPAPSATGRTK